MPIKANKGEWSELYAFAKLLHDGKIYAADENVNKCENMFFPILKIIREERDNGIFEYLPGDVIKIYKNNQHIADVPVSKLISNEEMIFQQISDGPKSDGAFAIPDINQFLDSMHIRKIKADSTTKADMTMQIHDIQTGYKPTVGFSVKSDLGSPPTLLNAGKNTRFRYRVDGLGENEIKAINGINSTTSKHYMMERMERLFSSAERIVFDSVVDDVYADNLTMIDSLMPWLYGEVILEHFRNMDEYDCREILKKVAARNPLRYKRRDFYEYKFKKLLCASALGMTPGKIWSGHDEANGGYIIIKRDGNVFCYHLYNRDFFEQYLLNNTNFDRPSASRYDYAYIFMQDGQVYIDLNVQIRFKKIPDNNS